MKRRWHAAPANRKNSSSGNNWTGYVNPELDAAINAERVDVKSTDAATFAARKADFAKVEHILGDNVVVYFMWADNVGMAFNGVSGVVQGAGGAMNYADQARNTWIYAQWSMTSPK